MVSYAGAFNHYATTAAMPSLRGAGGLCLPPVCAPPFRFTENAVFGTSLNDKTTDNDEEREQLRSNIIFL